MAALLSGVGSYVFLVVVARNTSVADYSDFAVFWSMTVVVGLGLFYPLEQETAREVAGTAGSAARGLAGIVWSAAGIVVALLSVLSLVFLTPYGREYIGSAMFICALLVSFAGYAIQFPIRGFLSGAGRTTSYSLLVALEGLLRITLPVVLVFVGAYVVGAAASVSAVPFLFGRDRKWLARKKPPLGLFVGRLGRLIVAAVSIQLLLNSGVLVAKALGEGADSVLAAQILTCISVARIPIFGYQVLQILYLPRLAAQWKNGQIVAARVTIRLAVRASVAIAIVIVVAMLTLGNWATALLFGSDLVLSQHGVLFVSVGVAVFLIALVASDGALAVGLHTVVLRSWMLALVFGVGAAATAAVVAAGTLLTSTLPLMVGSTVALLSLAYGLKYRFSREQGKVT
jgi:O-antigen/teichoic acid export membrane protein